MPGRHAVWRATPPDLRLIGVAALGFVAVGAALSALTGAPFNPPTERMSLAIGVNYVVPFAVAIAGYAAAQGLYAWRGRLDSVRLKAAILADVYFMILFVVVIYVHFHVKMWAPLINPRLFDAAYFAIDADLRGLVEASFAVHAIAARAIPNIDVWYQFGFLSLYALSLWFHAVGERRYHHHNLIALLLLEIAGALTYLIAPAVGPFVFEPGVNAVATESQGLMLIGFRQVRAGGAEWLAAHGGAYFTGPLAAMPSLHVAAAWIIAYYAYKASLPILPWIIIMLAWIAVESVAARWHYLVDLPPGLLLAVLIIVATNRICANRRP